MLANGMTLRIVCDSNRRLLIVENDSFKLNLNGMTNADYAAVLKPLGIKLEFEAVSIDIAAIMSDTSAIEES